MTEHEQVVGSTTAELTDRLAVLREKYGKRGYPMPRLRELHLIRSELYCRRNGITSKPDVSYIPPFCPVHGDACPTARWQAGERT